MQAPDTPKTTDFSDVDLHRWKEYDDLILESLWLLGPRDKTGPHLGDYWGNFVPQIPNQVLRRFTKRGEVVVDLFSGMGTTLIECRHLGRHGVGVELLPEIAERSRERIAEADNPHQCETTVIVGDSRLPSIRDAVRAEIARLGRDHADCIILHPPYFDIIKFSDHQADLSNTATLPEFLEHFARVVANAHELLRPGRFMALVVGDLYARGEWVPLGFQCMEVCRQNGFQLKAINVKDIQGNERGKGKNENLWRYRALKLGFYIFKHEYVMVFRKPA